MFDDLIRDIGERGYKVFAYADDLEVIGYGKKTLKELIKQYELDIKCEYILLEKIEKE